MRFGHIAHLVADIVLLSLALGFLNSCSSHPDGVIVEPELQENTMYLKGEQLVSAQVMLQSASGRVIDGETIITSENIQEFTPSPETVAKAREIFVAAGFDVGEMVGISFSITAPVNTFEQVFETTLRQNEQGGINTIQEDGIGNYEIPLNAVPESLEGCIVAVTFTPPPDFGPTDFFEP